MSFDAWYDELSRLAASEKFALSDDRDSFREYYDDGDSPAETLAMEMDYARTLH